jgi:hypothetical protein
MATPEEQVPVAQEAPKREVSGRQLALVLGGVVVLILVLWLLFFRGGGEDETTTAPPVPPPATTPAPETGGNGDNENGAGDGPVETFEVFAPKDPFDPLITEGTGSGSTDTGGTTTDPSGTDTGTTDTTTDTSTDTTTDTSTGTDTDGDGTVDSGSGTSGGDSSEDVSGHSVELVSTLGGGRAQIQVDSTVYTVDEGERFAENFELVSVSSECATLLYGDDQFSLCEGEEILK